MATYAIGDVQGCYTELRRLLKLLKFDPEVDRLWLLGDLINRGSESLSVVRFVMSLGKSARTVLGNHDLHFLAIVLGGHSANRADTFQDILNARDVAEIADWYCQQSMLVKDLKLGYVMTHAGIPHLWDLQRASELAAEVEAAIRGKERASYFKAMYGNEPYRWSDKLKGMARLRAITNYLTRMRLMSKDGTLEFAHKGPLSEAPKGFLPWYQLRAKAPLGVTTLFGHWAALEGVTGYPDVIALDTGCVWGRELTAFCLETKTFTRVSANAS